MYSSEENPDDIEYDADNIRLVDTEISIATERVEYEQTYFHQLITERNADDCDAINESDEDIKNTHNKSAEDKPKKIADK